MKICYLLESTELCGGVRVVFDQVCALQKRGHNVVIRALRGDHKWYPYQLRIDYVSDLAENFSRMETKPDVVIATFWTTVKSAMKIDSNLTFHLCQGYEGDFVEYSHLRNHIQDVYKIPIPKIIIGKWLSERLEKIFGVDSFKTYYVGQIIDLDIFRPLPSWKRRFLKTGSKNIKILIVGLYECSFKGIPYALHAVTLLRAKGFDIHLIRVSPGSPSAEEGDITYINEYHTHISPKELARIFQISDLLLAPSLSQEGFGLPFAEALACGLPCVATTIPSYLGFDQTQDYACFVPEKDSLSMAESAVKIIKDKHLQDTLRKKGPEVVNRKFRSEVVAERLEALFVSATR